MKLAILFYAVFTIVGSVDQKELISWGLTFDNHEECIQFYDKNSEKLIAGVKDHASKHYNLDLHLTELGCAQAISNFDEVIPEDEDRPAQVSLKIPLFVGSSI
tara:strand:- start:197 stop:505 length:309 start_codon:yes stop_codon:yes gene_type:complete